MKIILGGLLLGLALPALAQSPDTPAVVLDESDATISLRAVLGDDTSFKRSVRLRVENSFGGHFAFLPSDLKQVNGPLVIDRSNIILIGEPQLDSSSPRDFEVRITNVTQPGEYQGTLEFFLDNQVDRMKPRPFHLTVLASPTLALADVDRVRASRANRGACFFGETLCPGATLADAMLPAELTRDDLVLTVRNPSAVPATPSSVQVQLRGERTNYVLTDKEISVAGSLPTIEPGATAAITVNLARAHLPPEHYTGTITLLGEGGARLLESPAELSVRAAPSLAVLLMVLGVFLGRLLKSLYDRGNAANLALAEIRNVQRRLARAPSDVRESLSRRLDALRGQVMRSHLANFREELDAIDEAIFAGQSVTSASVPLGGARPRGWRAFTFGLGRVFGTASAWGDDGVGSLARTMLYVVVTGALMSVGMHAFYVTGGETFGVHPLSDYMMLFLWGLTADVTSRAISSLRR